MASCYKGLFYPDQIFSKEQIINTVYKKNEKIINERTVDVHIKNLRKKSACPPPRMMSMSLTKYGW
ncbi:winged helix-turn-helix domain-containing protein [Neobacillus niacini]|uniref:winged helix-turn-helix domain-containing protein n=1 Tax=Neobacillus niacini TaxID=86668 RepID=UPI0037C6AB18